MLSPYIYIDRNITLLTVRFTILCTFRLQPPRDDCAVRVQWFSSVNYKKQITFTTVYEIMGATMSLAIILTDSMPFMLS